MRIRLCFTAESGITHAQDFVTQTHERATYGRVYGLCGYSEQRLHIGSVRMPERAISCQRCWDLATENRNPKPPHVYSPHPPTPGGGRRFDPVRGEWTL